MIIGHSDKVRMKDQACVEVMVDLRSLVQAYSDLWWRIKAMRRMPIKISLLIGVLVLKTRLSFAFPHDDGSPNSLAKKDPLDVGTLSCRVTFKPISRPLQPSLRFFQHPTPALSWASLTSRFPISGDNSGLLRSI
jgi:hypothetical protein